MMSPWLLIDDSPDEARAFVHNLAHDDRLPIEYIRASAAAEALGAGTLKPAGVLMDVDLSNKLGPQQTGPGMSQSIRVAQQTQSLPPFPLVRFSFLNKFLESIGRDSSSDDIFDLKIEKNGPSNPTLRDAVRSKLVGVRQIYNVLEQGEQNLLSVIGLDVTPVSSSTWT